MVANEKPHRQVVAMAGEWDVTRVLKLSDN